MPDPTTPAKGLTQPTVGGDSNTWGDLLNTDLELIDTALGGTVLVSISGDTTLNDTQIENTGYKFTGTLSANATITWPSFSGLAVLRNATTGGFSINCAISGATVTVLNGETVSVWSDSVNFFRLAQVGGGGVGAPSSVHTSNYTAQTSDAGSVIQMGTGTTSLLTITLPSVTGFVANAEITVKNGDTARGKVLSGFPADLYPMLWPQQSATVKVVNGVWTTTYNPGRWRLDGAAQTFFVDHAHGSDAITNDGLGTGTGAFATIMHAALMFQQEVDCNGWQPFIQVAQETFSESVSLNGRFAYGANNLQILGDPSAPDNCVWQPGTTSAGDLCLASRDNAVTVVAGFKFVARGTGQTALEAAQDGILAFEDVDFGQFSGGTHLNGTGGTLTYEGGTYTVSGNMNFHIALTGPSIFLPVGGNTISVPNPLTFLQWLFMEGSGAFFECLLTFTGGGAGSGSTGEQYAVAVNASAILNGTTLPGATPGSTNNGGVVIA